MESRLKVEITSFVLLFLCIYSNTVQGAVTKIKPKCTNCKSYIGPQGPQGIAGVDATNDNYLFVSNSISQGAGMQDVYQNVVFDTVEESDGWVVESNNIEFTCNQAALYLFSYTATLSNSVQDFGTVELVLLVDDVIVDKSRLVSGVGYVLNPDIVTNNFFCSLQENQKIKMQIKASEDTIQLQADTNGTITPSISLIAVRIK